MTDPNPELCTWEWLVGVLCMAWIGGLAFVVALAGLIVHWLS